MQTVAKHKNVIVFGILLILTIVCMNRAYSTEQTREHTYIVGPQKSDMQRMIEAYESLSKQYLTLVQQNLSMMAAQDQQIIQKLDTLEKKIDALTKKVEALESSSKAAQP